MNFWPKLKIKKWYTGISINGSYLTFVALSYKSKKGYQLKWYKRIKATSETKIFKTGNLIVALPYKLILSKIIPLDIQLKEREIKKIVIEHIQQNYNDIFSSLIIDFEKLRSEQKSLNHVRWAAAKRQDIERTIEHLQTFHIKPSAIDIDAFALQHLGFFLSQQMRLFDMVIAIVHIQEESALICVIKNNECLFTHHMQHYLDLLTNVKSFPIQKIWLSFGTEADYKFILNDIKNNAKAEVELANPFLHFDLRSIHNTTHLTENASFFALACALAMRAANEY